MYTHPSFARSRRCKWKELSRQERTSSQFTTRSAPTTAIFKMALYGSFLLVPLPDPFPVINEADFHPLAMPGAVRPAESGNIILNPGRPRVTLTVTNKGTRAAYVSHAI